MYTASGGQRTGIPKVVIVFTDGGSNDKQATQDEAFLLRKSGVTIIVIGIGNWIDMMELNNMASFPYQSNRLLISFTNLSSIQNIVRDSACNGEMEFHIIFIFTNLL